MINLRMLENSAAEIVAKLNRMEQPKDLGEAMLKFSCSCGGETFRANRRFNMLQCCNCSKRFIWEEGVWAEFRTWKEVRKLAIGTLKQTVEVPKQFVKEQVESMGAWLSRHGITKERPGKIRKQTLRQLAKKSKGDALIMTQLRRKWYPIISIIKKNGSITFNPQSHIGKLRGNHIAKVAHRDLKRLGFKTRLKFENDKSTLELVK